MLYHYLFATQNPARTHRDVEFLFIEFISRSTKMATFFVSGARNSTDCPHPGFVRRSPHFQ